MPGGSSPPSGGSLPPSGENRLPPTVKGYRTVTITSFDGTPIVFTVFEPALKAGETAPLVIHGHGFGGHRIRSPEDASTDSKLISDTVFRLWEAGYHVISFDQRGFGDSGGYVRVMDPDVEIRDVQAILRALPKTPSSPSLSLLQEFLGDFIVEQANQAPQEQVRTIPLAG
ncbi:hypothetical protein KZX47_12980, partial [Thermus sp. SYSU G05001]|nr:hypothetical protein [Thermus brevis]